MTTPSWIRNLFTRPVTRTIRNTPRPSRPALETLEDRWCPSAITVLTNGDGDGVLTSTGPGTYTAPTLRAAIAGANTLGGAETITFDPIAFATPQIITLNLNLGQLELSDTTGIETITGPAAGVTVSGGGPSRVFQIDARVTASISGLTITGGNASGSGTAGDGGGVLNNGMVTLTNCTVSGNTATGSGSGISGSYGGGGGLFNNGGGTATLTNCTVSENSAASTSAISPGGGLYNLSGGTMILTNCTVSGNTAGTGSSHGGTGGGMFNSGSVALTNCTISSNSSGTKYIYGGGGGLNNPGTMTLTNCTISGNSAGGDQSTGGGLRSNGGTATLINCTISRNSANYGGGMWCGTVGTKTLTNCTVSGNTAVGKGGGLCILSGGTLILGNTIVAGNTIGAGAFGPYGPDVFGTVASQGNNLIGKTDGSTGLVGGSNLTGTVAKPLDPQLADLASNGGPTETMALLSTSPAIDAGNNALIPAGVTTVTTDQRGTGFPRIANGTVNIGAYETSVPTSIAVISSTGGTSTYGTSVTFTATVTVTSSGAPVTSGNVQFYSDGIAFGSPVSVDSDGDPVSASISTLQATGSPHVITADYVAVTDYQASIGTLDGGQAVTPRAITITANNQSTTYGTNDSSLDAGYTLSSGSIDSGDALTSVTLATTDGVSNSGNFHATTGSTITASAASGTGGFNTTNYAITYDSGTLTVSQLGLTISGLTASKTYDSSTTGDITIGGSPTLNTPITGDSVSINSASASAAFTDPNAGIGNKSVNFSGYALQGTDSGNYSLSQPSISTGTINPAAITITANNQSTTYGTNDTSLDAGYTVSSGSIVSGDAITSVTLATTDGVSTSGNFDATTGSTITASAASGTGGFNTTNYAITYDSGTLTVSQLGLTISGLTASKTYDGSTTGDITIGGSPTLNTPITGDSVSINSASASAAFTDPNAGIGNKSVNFSGYALQGTDSGNYSLSQPSISTGTINPYAFSYMIASTSHVYGTTDSFSTLAATIATGVNGENLDIAYSSVGNTVTAQVGSSSPITGTLSSGSGLTSDYSVTLTSGALTVTPYAFSYTITSTSHVYGTTDSFSTLAPTIATGVNGENLDIAYSSVGNTVTAQVGSSSPITGTLSSGSGLTSDYSVTLTNGALTVTPYAFSYTIQSDSHVYGTLDTFSTLAPTIATGVNGENLDIAYSSVGNTVTAQVGSSSPITGTLSSGSGLTSDYSVTLTNGALTVTPYAFSYTITSTSHVYGTTDSFSTLAPTIATGVNGENLDIAYSSVGNTVTAQVGSSSPIRGTLSSGSGLTSDYSVTLTNGALTVTPYAFSYTIQSDSHVYGTTDSFSTLAATIATGVNGENLDIAYSSVGNTVTAHVGSSSAITGTLSSGSGLTSDYSVTLTSGALTVTPYAFSYTITSTSHVYGTTDSFSTLAATIATGVNGENLDIAYSSVGNTVTAQVGSSSAITGTLSSGSGLTSDYSVTLTNGALTVTPYAFSYTIQSDSHVYGTTDSFSTLAATIATGVNGENLDIAYSSVGNTVTAQVGSSSPITGTLSSGSGLTSDYSVTLTSGALTVTPYAFSYTIQSDSHVYGTTDSFSTLAATIATGVNGENLDIAYSSVGNTVTAQVGSSSAITGTLSSGSGLTSDYSVTLTNGALTVTPYAFSYTITSTNHVYGTLDTFSTLAPTVATGVNGENLDIAYSSVGNTVTAQVGSSSAITGTLSSGSGLTSDYSVTLTNGALTVTPYAFSYTIQSDSHVYGTTDSFSTLAATIATGVNGENLDIAYSSVGNTVTAQVGSSSPITGTLSSGSGLTSDYSVTLTNGALTVTPYAFSYTIQSDSHVYGTLDTFSTLAATIATGVNGENLDIAYSSVGNTVTAHVGSSSAITGTLSSGSGLTSDYSVTLTNGALTVTPYAFSYTITSTSHVYGTTDSFSTLTPTIATGVNGENLDIAYSSVGNTVTAQVGSSSAITGTLSSGSGLTSDYSVTLTNGALTVTPYAFSYTIQSDSHVYGTLDTFSTLAPTVATGVNGENLDIAYSSVGNTVTAQVGSSSPITGTLSSGSGLTSDYSVTLTNGALTVTPYAFNYTIANDTQTYGSPANLAHDLGTTINTGVNGENLDIVYSSSGDTATAAVGAYSITGVLSNGSGMLSNYTVTLDPGTLTVTTVPGSIYVLNPTAAGALSVSGNASINPPGDLIVDSTSASAVLASGNASLKATGGLYVEGSVSKSGNAVVQTAIHPAPLGDPLASLPLPAIPAGSAYNTAVAENLGGNSTATISQGSYSTINVSGNASLTLNAGVYVIGTGGVVVSGNGVLKATGVTFIIKGGGLSVSGNASLSGSGVLIFNAGSAYNGTTDGGTYGSITFGGNGTISLSGPTSWPYAGVVIFQSRSNTKALSLSGNGTAGITSTIYAPSANAGLSGNAEVNGSLIVSTLTVSGNAGAFQLAGGASSDYVASTNNWITDSVLTVAVEDDAGNGITSDELNDVSEAMTYLNQALGQFGVNLSWAAAGTNADVNIHFATTSPEGDASDGVLGFTTASNDVYLVEGWNWYTGDDSTQIGAGQYDFLTLTTHELAHTVGLGESVDPSSVLYEYLAPGTVRRTFTDGNLSLIDTNADRFMKAAQPAVPATMAAALSNPFTVGTPGMAIGPLPAGPFGWESALWESSVSPKDGHVATSPGLDGDGSVLMGGPGHDLVISGQGRNLMADVFGLDGVAEDHGAEHARDQVFMSLGEHDTMEAKLIDSQLAELSSKE